MTPRRRLQVLADSLNTLGYGALWTVYGEDGRGGSPGVLKLIADLREVLNQTEEREKS